MATREDLTEWVYEAVREHGGKATLLDVSKSIWTGHQDELKRSGDLFFTWQYDMRWSAQQLRDAGKFRPNHLCKRGFWELASG